MSFDPQGTWVLVAWRRIAADGAVTYPLGDDAAGTLIYAPHGQMAVVLTAAERPELPEGDPLGGPVEDRAQAYSTCLAYAGTWELRGEELHHEITQCLYPDWAGAEQVRPYTFDGDELVLRTPPMNGSVNELAWRRKA